MCTILQYVTRFEKKVATARSEISPAGNPAIYKMKMLMANRNFVTREAGLFVSIPHLLYYGFDAAEDHLHSHIFK